MCFGTNANKWAPKLVIFLQLATWTIVGLVLLQRGASSLRTPIGRAPHAVRAQVDPSEVPSFLSGRERTKGFRGDGWKEHRPPDESSGMMLLAGNSRKGLRAIREGERIQSEGHVAGEKSWAKVDQVEHGKNESTTVRTVEERAGTENDTLSRLEAGKGIGPAERGSASRKRNGTREAAAGPAAGRAGATTTVAASGAAAAAAVAMLVIGVVMLVLGPAIVILRALEGRRRARRVTKSRTRKDLPPSYEQATLMDEAPRYSTLHLNLAASPDSSLLPGPGSSFSLPSGPAAPSQPSAND